jgi:CBS domain-containing protein
MGVAENDITTSGVFCLPPRLSFSYITYPSIPKMGCHSAYVFHWFYDTFNSFRSKGLLKRFYMTKASDVMRSNLVAARGGTTVREVISRLLIGNFNGLPVIDANLKVIGIVTAVDVLRAVRQGRNLDTTSASEIMTRNPVVVKHDTDLNEIIDIILQKAIILVPVIDEERRLIGVVGRLDILQHNIIEKFITIGGRKV